MCIDGNYITPICLKRGPQWLSFVIKKYLMAVSDAPISKHSKLNGCELMCYRLLKQMRCYIVFQPSNTI